MAEKKRLWKSSQAAAALEPHSLSDAQGFPPFGRALGFATGPPFGVSRAATETTRWRGWRLDTSVGDRRLIHEAAGIGSEGVDGSSAEGASPTFSSGAFGGPRGGVSRTAAGPLIYLSGA